MGARRRRNEYFGHWLDLTMGNKQISGTELARRAGVDGSVVSRWRAGTVTPTLESCDLLAEVLGVDPLRLAATAGALPGRMAKQVAPLPMPPPIALRARVIQQIEGIKGVGEDTRDAMLAAFDEAEKVREHG
jgi:transcriptional regulator with XRE-family HTH domain